MYFNTYQVTSNIYDFGIIDEKTKPLYIYTYRDSIKKKLKYKNLFQI